MKALHCTLHRTARTILSGAIHYWPQRLRPIFNLSEEEIYLDTIIRTTPSAILHCLYTACRPGVDVSPTSKHMTRLGILGDAACDRTCDRACVRACAYERERAGGGEGRGEVEREDVGGA